MPARDSANRAGPEIPAQTQGGKTEGERQRVLDFQMAYPGGLLIRKDLNRA